jgi:ribosomal protein S18 acetylase RimI-like enzyme
MNTLISRVYTGTPDLQRMIELTQTLRAAGQRVYPIATDLYEELAEVDVQVTARLWENDQGQLVGFAYVSRYQNLVDVFDARELTPALEKELLDWAVSAVQRRNLEKGEPQTLDASSLEDDQARLAFLEQAGFERQKETSLLLARPIDDALPAPQLPPGFAIRPMGGEAEVEAYVALHQAAFGTENMTVEYRRTIMSAPDYKPELDLVAVAPNGDLAAFCVCQIFPDDSPRAGGQKEGWTDPVGTHPNYQRLGLARALILTGMGLLKVCGIDTAIMGTSSTNIPMQCTAEALGFQRVSNTLWFCKTV